MTDDKNNRGPADRDGVNVYENYELRYWSSKFGCTHEALKVVVKKVGVLAKDVEAELKRSKGR